MCNIIAEGGNRKHHITTTTTTHGGRKLSMYVCILYIVCITYLLHKQSEREGNERKKPKQFFFVKLTLVPAPEQTFFCQYKRPKAHMKKNRYELAQVKGV